MLEALESRRTSTLRYVDIYSLGAAMPDETLWYVYLRSVCCSSLDKNDPACPEPRTVNGHGTQILQQWTWQALLGVKQFTERVSVTSSNQSPINSKVKHLHHLSRKLDFSSWSFLCFKAKYVLGWVLCLFA